jgi:hypothetical protein
MKKAFYSHPDRKIYANFKHLHFETANRLICLVFASQMQLSDCPVMVKEGPVGEAAAAEFPCSNKSV